MAQLWTRGLERGAVSALIGVFMVSLVSVSPVAAVTTPLPLSSDDIDDSASLEVGARGVGGGIDVIAAALTYVAAAVTSIVTLLYYLSLARR